MTVINSFQSSSGTRICINFLTGQTVVVPTDLTFYDPGTNGELWFTISNIASYSNTDVIKIYNSSGNAELGATSKTRYAARAFGAGAFASGYGIVPGLTNGTAYTLYAKATSDNNTFSAATANASAQTPTLAATDAAYLALETTRNSKTAAAGDILTTKSVTIAGTVTNGTFDEAARNKFNTGTTVADLASGKSVKIQNVDQNGTSDKVYSATDETTRNTVPDLTKIPTAATGGPATWKQLNVDRDGTMDLDAAKTAYENSRNSGASTGKIVSGQSIVQKGTTYNGTAAAEAHTANQVIHSAGGNFVDETVLAGNLKTGITAGLGVNGTVIPEAHTANQVLKSAGGNWDDDNILSQLNATANVKNTLAVGLGWTGGLTSGSSDPDTIVSSAGGNWNDSHLLPGDEVNVASGVAFGLSQVGTGIMNIPIHYTPRFGITTFDSATFTDQNIVPLKKPLPMDLNGYSAFLTLEQLESDDSFQLLQLSLEGQAFSGRFV